MSTTKKVIIGLVIAAGIYLLTRKKKDKAPTVPPASKDTTGTATGTQTNFAGNANGGSALSTLNALKAQRSKAAVALSNARANRNLTAVALQNQMQNLNAQIDMWEGKLWEGKASVYANNMGLNGNTPGRAVTYGCKDGSTSKTASGCAGHGGADWVKTY